MTLPFYVAPEQLVKDRAEYARKGIARGRSIAALEVREGVLLLAENPSRTLTKTSEIYDRIAFAGVGKYNEFESLRVAGIRYADVKGYQYGRRDVTAKSLASAFSQTLGNIFVQGPKPFEVEVLVAEVGRTVAEDHVEGADAVGRDDQQGLAAVGHLHVVQIANLATAPIGQIQARLHHESGHRYPPKAPFVLTEQKLQQRLLRMQAVAGLRPCHGTRIVQ